MSQEAPPGSVPRCTQSLGLTGAEGPPSSKDVSNPRQKITKQVPVFLTTNSSAWIARSFYRNDFIELTTIQEGVHQHWHN